MTLTLLQIVVSLFVLFALSRVILRTKSHEIGWRESLFWILVWLGTATVVWVPATVTLLSRTLGLGAKEPVDTLVYLAIMVLFYLVYRIHAKQEKLNHELTRLVRAVSLGKK